LQRAVPESQCEEEAVSTRFGIELVMEPAFTARAYRVRNIICGQYASWAAEMQMLRLSVVGYFPCSDSVLDLLAHGTARLADDSRKRSPHFSNNCRGVATGNGSGAGSEVYLDFDASNPNHPLMALHRDAINLLGELPGAERPPEPDGFHPKIHLMEHASLPPTVMADALEFAKGVAIDVGVPTVARAWRLELLRYHSEAAGDDWGQGGWAADLRWEHVSSYVV